MEGDAIMATASIESKAVSPYNDFRDFLAALEARGKLRRVSQAVDLKTELACVARWVYQGLPEKDRFGLSFDRIKGFDIAVVTAALGASRENYAIGLGVDPDQINERWSEALRHPIAPRVVNTAPSQEVVHTGKDVDLATLPIPTWTPVKDVAPYITTNTITRDLATGVQNVGVYRTQVLDGQHVVVNLSPGRHGFITWQTYVQAGKTAPIAWAIGCEPAVHLAAVANVPYGVDEIAIAGGLKGAPVAMVKAKTIDLMVPANAEYIIEGEIQVGDVTKEGPFGEFQGYMGPVADKPRVTITAITHRRKPIYYGYISQMPPSESTTIQSNSNAALLVKQLHDLGHRTVRDAYIDLTYGGLLAHAIISMKPLHPAHAKIVGRLAADISTVKRVTVVSEGVDIRDPLHLDWALNSCYNPREDTVIIDNVLSPMNMDPAAVPVDGKPGKSSKVVIDATEKVVRPFSVPPADLMERARTIWTAAGLPPFEVSARTRQLLARG